jgi:membrane associated rhomboid family serine protease
MVMGIYDRDYYRSEGPGFLDSFTRHGQVCKWLIGINIVVYILEFLTRYQEPGGFEFGQGYIPWRYPLLDYFTLDTEAVAHGQVWRLLTYAFLHAPESLSHILFNMLFLWWFGSDIEDLYGPKEFLAFYLLSAFIGGLAFQLGWMLHLTPGARLCLGASGAVTAVLVVCACHFPTRVIYLFLILPIPIWLFVLFSVAQDLFGFLGGNHGETAYTVHLGGAAFGFLYHRMNWRVMNWLPSFSLGQRQRGRPNLRIHDPDPPSPVPVSGQAVSEEHLEAQLDAILEKVARSGQNSLTESERQILIRASEIYRKRRS